MLVRAGEDLPLLLISYPRGSEQQAGDIEAAYARTLRGLSSGTRAAYAPVFQSLPTMIVVLLRAKNPCECLGHHHPRGTESRLTRRLAAELGSPIGEIDLAYQGIRQWRPQPLSSMAIEGLGPRLEALHFQAAVLAVLLHEMEHLAFPEKPEQEIRNRSNRFYAAAMEELVAAETGYGYGMAGPPSRA